MGVMNMSLRNGSDYILGLDEYKSDLDLASVKLFLDYSKPLQMFAFACSIIFMIIGIPGNLVTITALARCKKVHNATAVFIINLALSDLLMCCFNQPLVASTYWNRSWTHGKLMCRLFALTRFSFGTVSVMSVLAITVNRYILMLHPTLYTKLYTKRNILVMISGLWIFPFVVFTMSWLGVGSRLSLNSKTGTCTIVPDEDNHSPKTILIAIFAIPATIIIVCYVRIYIVVRKSKVKVHVPTTNSDMLSTTIDMPVTTLASSTEEPVQKELLSTDVTPELSSSTDPGLTSEIGDGQSAPKNRASQGFLSVLRSRTYTAVKLTKAYIKPKLPSKKDKRLFTMIAAILTAFCVCYIPIVLLKVAFRDDTSTPLLDCLGYIFMYIGTWINPIIYVVMSREYRMVYKDLIKCG